VADAKAKADPKAAVADPKAAVADPKAAVSDPKADPKAADTTAKFKSIRFVQKQTPTPAATVDPTAQATAGASTDDD